MLSSVVCRVQVALKMKKKGIAVRAGDHVPYVITKDDSVSSFAQRAYDPDAVRQVCLRSHSLAAVLTPTLWQSCPTTICQSINHLVRSMRRVSDSARVRRRRTGSWRWIRSGTWSRSCTLSCRASALSSRAPTRGAWPSVWASKPPSSTSLRPLAALTASPSSRSKLPRSCFAAL